MHYHQFFAQEFDGNVLLRLKYSLIFCCLLYVPYALGKLLLLLQ